MPSFCFNLSPGEIKKDNSLMRISHTRNFAIYSFSPSIFQYHLISFFHFENIWELLYPHFLKKVRVVTPVHGQKNFLSLETPSTS